MRGKEGKRKGKALQMSSSSMECNGKIYDAVYFLFIFISTPNKSFALFKKKVITDYSGCTTAKCLKERQSTFCAEAQEREGEIQVKKRAFATSYCNLRHSNTVWQGSRIL